MSHSSNIMIYYLRINGGAHALNGRLTFVSLSSAKLRKYYTYLLTISTLELCRLDTVICRGCNLMIIISCRFCCRCHEAGDVIARAATRDRILRVRHSIISDVDLIMIAPRVKGPTGNLNN